MKMLNWDFTTLILRWLPWISWGTASSRRITSSGIFSIASECRTRFDFLLTFSYSQDEEDHICGSRAFQVYDLHFDSVLSKPNGKKLFLFSIWVDEYRKSLVSTVMNSFFFSHRLEAERSVHHGYYANRLCFHNAHCLVSPDSTYRRYSDCDSRADLPFCQEAGGWQLYMLLCSIRSRLYIRRRPESLSG